MVAARIEERRGVNVRVLCEGRAKRRGHGRDRGLGGRGRGGHVEGGQDESPVLRWFYVLGSLALEDRARHSTRAAAVLRPDPSPKFLPPHSQRTTQQRARNTAQTIVSEL